MRRRPRTIRSPLFRKILVGAALLVFAMGGLSDLLMSRYTQEREESAVRRSLEASVRLLARELAGKPLAELAEWVRQTDRLLGVRVTVVAGDGSVLAESRRQPESMENHAHRPEIEAAVRTGLGAAKRHSNSVNMDFLYVAAPARLSTGEPAILRVAAPLETIESAVRANRWRILRATLALAFLVLVAAYLFTRSLTQRIHRIQEAAEDFASGRFTENPPMLDSGQDELGALAASLHRMAGNLLEMVELVRAESARRDAILSSMREGVLAVDASLRITFCNQAFLDAVAAGQAPGEGTPLEQVAPDGPLLDSLLQVLERGETVRTKISLASSPGRSYELYAKPLELNRQKGALAILHDVTEIERLERVRRDFVANVSHELRTPLTLILGYLDLLREGSLGRLTDDQQQALRAIERHGKRLRFMVERLLLLQSFDVSLMHPAREDVGSWLRQTVEAWSRPEIAGACQIRLDLPDDLPPIYAELNYLDRVLENLLDNAIKFSPAGGQIVVAARASDTEVIVSVADQGIGLAPEKQRWLFERFYQADSGLARRFGGLGIGLALCKLIVEAHRGRIWAESAGEGQGCTFYFALPRADILLES